MKHRSELEIDPYTSVLPRRPTGSPYDTIPHIQGVVIPDTEPGEDLSSLMPDLWPGLDFPDVLSSDLQEWTSSSDPLLKRQFPASSSVSGVQETIETPEVDRKEPITAPRPVPGYSILRLPKQYRLIAFLSFLVLVLLAAIYITQLAFNYRASTTGVAVPVMTLSSSVVHPGDVIAVHLQHFPPSTQVAFSHDVQEYIAMSMSSPFAQVDATGNLETHITIARSWKSGFHTLQGEDIATHYTASTMLQVIGNGPVQSPHLAVSKTMLNMGKDVQGANSIQSLLLNNTGAGTISWMAQSNQPWLTFAPTQGRFSSSEHLFVAVSRAHMQPGTYHATLSIISDVGTPVSVQVSMTVFPLSEGYSGPLLEVVSPALSFSATDSAANPASQTVTIRNAGTQLLTWSVRGITPASSSTRSLRFLPDTHWASFDSNRGTVAAGATIPLHVNVHSNPLLPGMYSLLITFSSGQNGPDSQQPVLLTLRILPVCGVATSLGDLAFTTSVNQNQPVNQALAISRDDGCSAPLSWQAAVSETWLSITPASGTLSNNFNTILSVSANPDGLQQGTHDAFAAFITNKHTQVVMVQLAILSSSSSSTSGGGTQPHPGSTPDVGGRASGTSTATATSGKATPVSGNPSAPGGSGSAGGTTPPGSNTPVPQSPPVLSLGSTSLHFNATQGQSNPYSQAVAITNGGGSTLYWQAGSSASWLSLLSSSGSVEAGQSGQLIVNVNAAGLAPATYTTQVDVSATDSAGTPLQSSPQSFVVTLRVMPPCSLHVSPTQLSFRSILLGPNPPDQTLTLSITGGCAFPVSWTASVDTARYPWLSVSRPNGTDNGSGSTITVHVDTSGMVVSLYTAQIVISAVGNDGSAVQQSPQTVTVQLTVIAGGL